MIDPSLARDSPMTNGSDRICLFFVAKQKTDHMLLPRGGFDHVTPLEHWAIGILRSRDLDFPPWNRAFDLGPVGGEWRARESQ